MANILTASEAAAVLRCETTDANMLALLPQVDGFIKMASGRDWAADTAIRPEAKAAARMLLVRWHEDPGGMAAGASLGFGLSACLVQLEGLALELDTNGIPEAELALLNTNIAGKMAVSANFVLVFNHAMAASATSSVSMETVGGASVITVNSLDVTAKIMTINPTGDLQSDTEYRLLITGAADTYGQTLTTEINFWTA